MPRRLLTLAALSCAALSAAAQPDLARQIATLLNDPAVARDHWGIQVTALDGKPIYSLNEAQLFQPASNAKLFTTAAAMHLLGAERQLTTSLVGEAREPGSRMSLCDLRLRGSGDANFSSHDVPYGHPSDSSIKNAALKIDPVRGLMELADQFVSRVGPDAHVTGDVIGDDTLFPWEPYAPDWAADDLVWGYGAPVSALTIADNQLQLRIVPAWRDGYAADVTLDRAFGFYTLQASVLTVPAKTAASVQIDRALGSRVLRVSGTIAVDSKVFVEDVAIDDPAAYAAAALKSLLEARGIAVDGVARAEHRLSTETASFLMETREPLPNLTPGSTNENPEKTVYMTKCLLWIHQTSPRLIEDVVVTNKESQNLHAELLLRSMGKSYGHDGSTAQGARVVRQFLLNAGVDKDDFVFYDGSGLSGHDLVTPRAAAKLLQYATMQPWFPAWKASLPVGGVDGSLEHRFTASPLKSHVFAKTGTLGEARALSGYLDCASGRTVIFSIFDGNHLPSTSADRDVMDRIVAAIAAAN